ncbi:MAG: S24/S26 family peptidase [Desulfomonilaceae bacterium]
METSRNNPVATRSPREFTNFPRCLSFSHMTGAIFIYTGPSMYPTFTSQDILYVKPYGAARMRPGDVIAFQRDGIAGFVVHRIVTVKGDSGIKTRGDNNDCIDQWDLRPDQILGRVVHAKSRCRLRRIYGGFPGKMEAAYVSLRKWLRNTLFRILRKPYYRLVRAGTFHWVGDRFGRRIVTFQRDGLETELHLFMGGRFVGRFPRGSQKWEIELPFRLLIDENILPTPEPATNRLPDW